MLNIGRLAPGAADYYIGEVATSAEDYYTGKGESEGRWVGSLAGDLGLHGAVSPEAFRAVLDGRHPMTGERLARSRSGCRRHRRGGRNQPGLFDDDALDTARTASRLRLTVGRVRQLAMAGQRLGRHQGSSQYLRGTKVTRPGQRGPASWMFPRHEVERFEAEHQAAKARPGYDLTLRPPKSVSILWALGTPAQRAAIRQAHREAVDEVVAYVERHALFARRGTGNRGRIEVDGLVAAAFDHRTSRAGDPLLHTHVVTANLTLTADGRWQALDARGLYDHAKAGGCLYQAHLRHLLTTRLGVAWEPVRNGWAEVTGVPRRVVRAFSKRRDEIEAMVAESGYTSAQAHQSATLATRKAKEYGVAPEALDARWRAEAADLGFGADEVAACFDAPPEPSLCDVDAVIDDLVGPEGLTQYASTFARRDVVEALSERLVGAPAGVIEQAADRLVASPLVQPLAPQAGGVELVWRHGGGRTRSPDLARYSTPELLAIEAQLLGWAAEGFGMPVPAAHADHVAAVLADHPELSNEQVSMVRAVCSVDAPAIQPVAGRPGAGKTYATAAAVEALTRSGVPVVGCALSAVAAAELESATRLGPLTGREATTIARLLFDLDHRAALQPGSVVLIDEASMVGTRDLARLARHAARAGGALKLIGDPDQHGPVETGGAFRSIIRRQRDQVVQLVENNRQIDETDRACIDAYRQGLVGSALARYDAAGRIVRSPSAADSYDAMVAEWYGSAREGGRDPMIAGPNRTRLALNDRARRLLVADGTVRGPSLVAAEREFAAGDWVLARKNDSRLRSRAGGFVKNGRAGTVVAVDTRRRQLTVNFEKDGVIVLPAEYLDAGSLEHGYARTTYGVQGATLERALYHASDASSFEEGYVALTRGRSTARIFLVDGTVPGDEEAGHRAHDSAETGLDTVSEALERRRAKELALDADPMAARVHEEFAGWSLSQLRAERTRLEAVLAGAPKDVSATFAAAVRGHEKVSAGGQMRSPLVATKSPRWWPAEVSTPR